MNKDALKILIDEKAERQAKNKIEELRKHLERNFPYEVLSAMFKSAGFWGDGKDNESKKIKDAFFEKERELCERDFYQKVETIFYNLNN